MRAISQLNKNRPIARPSTAFTGTKNELGHQVRRPSQQVRVLEGHLVIMRIGRFVTTSGGLVPKLFNHLTIKPKLDRVDASVTAQSSLDPGKSLGAIAEEWICSPGVARTELTDAIRSEPDFSR